MGTEVATSKNLQANEERVTARINEKLDGLLESAAFRAEKGWEGESGFLHLKVTPIKSSSGISLQFELRPDRVAPMDKVTNEALWMMLFDPDPAVSKHAGGQLELNDYPIPSNADFSRVKIILSTAHDGNSEKPFQEIKFDREGKATTTSAIKEGRWVMLAMPVESITALKAPKGEFREK